MRSIEPDQQILEHLEGTRRRCVVKRPVPMGDCVCGRVVHQYSKGPDSTNGWERYRHFDTNKVGGCNELNAMNTIEGRTSIPVVPLALDYRSKMREPQPHFPRSWGEICVESSLSSLIEAAETGSSSDTKALFAALYSELHRLARRELAGKGEVSLSATTLLHEAYLDMSARESRFPDRARFMGYAARVMRGLIIDHARNRQAQKRGGKFEITTLENAVAADLADDVELTRVSEALDKLANVDAELAEVVDLKFFCGFSFAEIAAMRKLSERTVQRKWEKARIYLHRELRTDLT